MTLRAFSEPRLTLPNQRHDMTFEDVFREAYVPLDCRKKVGDYVLGSTIGEGSFSRVRRAKNVVTGEHVSFLSKYSTQLSSLSLSKFDFDIYIHMCPK